MSLVYASVENVKSDVLTNNKPNLDVIQFLVLINYFLTLLVLIVTVNYHDMWQVYQLYLPKSGYPHSKRVGFMVCSLNLHVFLNSDILSLKTQVQKHYLITELSLCFAFSCDQKQRGHVKVLFYGDLVSVISDLLLQKVISDDSTILKRF